MKTFVSAISATLAFTMATNAAPRLVVSTASLTPVSEIDLVLDSAVTAPTDLGKTVENTWLEIQPPLPGKLFWKAGNIARFIPDKSPTIGTTYSFSIPKDRKHLDNSPVPAGKFATVSSDPFRVIAANSPNRYTQDYSPSTGQWVISFNDDVDPAAAAYFVSFSSQDGRRVGAKVERATSAQAGYYGGSYVPWNDQFPGTQRPETTPESPVSHVIVATPDSPLPAGQGWTVVVGKGLANESKSAKTTEDGTYNIGNIEPFRVTGRIARTIADQPRTIVIEFNHPIPQLLPDDFLTSLLVIEPRPQNLTAKLTARKIELSGDFDASDVYHVSVKQPFLSRHGLPMEKSDTKKLTFERLEPELILPSDNQAQLANGSRAYRVHTVNLASLQVRVKKLAGADLIRAYQGYRHYTGSGHDGKVIEPTAPLPYSLVGGETILEKEIPLGDKADSSKEITLKWDELLPGQPRDLGIFLDITGISNSSVSGHGRRNAQAIIQLTDIGLAWKNTGKDSFIYAFSCDTGTPLPGVKIDVVGEDSAPLQSMTTDANGIATVPRSDKARHLRATLAGDSYLTAFDSTMDTVGLWHFPIRYSWNKSLESVRKAFLFTDRSLYRPGETVRMKGIVRNQRGNKVEPAAPGAARLLVLDPTDKEIHSADVTFTANGSFDFTYTLPAGKTGTHVFRLEFPDELGKADEIEQQDDYDWYELEGIRGSARFSLPVHVEEFRRNAFEIQQSITEPATGASSVSTDLAATYYQGQPVAAGKVKVFSHVAARNPYPERFRDYLFGNHRSEDWSYWYHYFGYRSDGEGGSGSAPPSQMQSEVQLSAEGKATLTTEIPQSDFPTTREVTISSEVTDANNQTLTSTSETLVHPSSVYVGVSRVDRLVRAGEALPLTLVSTDVKGEPFSGSVKVTATLTREINNAVKSRTDAGAATTRNEVTEETVSTTEVTLDPAASAGGGTVLTVTPKATGRHFLTLHGTDPDGRPFRTVTFFNAYGTNEYPWIYEDGMRVKLVAEKKAYKAGETARVLVLSPIEGNALVTVEREKILRSFSVPLKADKPVIEIPLNADDGPNVFVSVLIVKGAKESARTHKEPQLRLGYCELVVTPERETLAVTVAPDRPEEGGLVSYRPGEEVVLKGSVKFADGKPAAHAEVTLYAEDEGTLAVMGYETPNPIGHFYKPRNLDVETGTSFNTFISEDPETQYFHNKGFFIGGGGDLGKMADLLRKNFDPCATWAPAIVTDEAGNFSHGFTVPDTLTRYRVIAVAHQGGSYFGSKESSIVVKKDLMLEPKTPRFANQGDTFQAQVLVQNASAHEGTWEITYSTGDGAETPSVVSTGALTQTIQLAAGASATVVFPTRADHTGEAVLTWHATPVSLSKGGLDEPLKKRLSDAVETRFEVHYPMPLLRQTKLVTLTEGASMTDLPAQLDGKLLDGTGEIELEISRSPLVEAGGSIDFLLRYPYGCVEQTTSALIPWLAVEDLSPVVPQFASLSEEKVKTAIQGGVDRLLSMQLSDGSFAYWPGNTDTARWATAYAGMGLIMASEKGANVPRSAIDALVKNLSENLRGIADEKSSSALETQARALLVLAMAGSPQTAYRNGLVDRIAELTPSARALLATAIVLEDEGNEANIAVAKSVLTSKTPFKLKNDDWMPWSANGAYDLIAWIAVSPDGPEPAKALDRLLRERNPYGRWNTTWVNGWSLMAMAAYASNEGVDASPVSVTLDSGKGPETILLNEDTPVAHRTIKLAPGLKLEAASDRNAFIRVKIAAKPRIEPVQPVATNGLSVDRIFEKVNGDGSTTILTEPKVGDLIRVSLRVTLPNDDTRYLVVEDSLPSGFETVNTDFKSQRAAVGIGTSENDWNISHSELRTDRACFFMDYIWRKGTYTVSYLARCTVAGVSYAPPAKVESMYDPEAFALSASRLFTAE